MKTEYEWQTGPLPPAEPGKHLLIVNTSGISARHGVFTWGGEHFWMTPHGDVATILYDGRSWRVEGGK